jgi:REP element-mobilizing transposase RayT
MARKPRLHVPGGLYHVILRGNARQDILFRAEDRPRKSDDFANTLSQHIYAISQS